MGAAIIPASTTVRASRARFSFWGSSASQKRSNSAQRCAFTSGRRLDRTATWRLVRRLARAAGIAVAEHISAHNARHAFGTGALDAGVPLRDVQNAMGPADPRTTRRYDRSRPSLDRHATHAVAAWLAEDLSRFSSASALEASSSRYRAAQPLTFLS